MTKQELELKIKELQKIIIEKDKELDTAYIRFNELQADADEKFMKSPYCKQLTRDLEMMKEAYKTEMHRLELSHQREEKLRERLEILEKSAVVPKHNERNAGRKKSDEKWVASYTKWQELYESQKSINEIMKETRISRATYYRYKKFYNDTMLNSI